jgi:hypothetical protein
MVRYGPYDKYLNGLSDLYSDSKGLIDRNSLITFAAGFLSCNDLAELSLDWKECFAFGTSYKLC